MKKNSHEYLLTILKKGCIPATGCTEPISVAYAVATAVEAGGDRSVQRIDVYVDEGLYKNGAAVGIPGIKERGLKIAAALGAVVGSAQDQLRLLEKISLDQVEEANRMVLENKVDIQINERYKGFYLEVIVETESQQVRVLVLDHHQNVVSVEKGEKLEMLKLENVIADKKLQPIQDFDLSDFIEFSQKVDLSDIEFLEEGIQMVKAISKTGQKRINGFGQMINKMNAIDILNDSLLGKVQMFSGAASEARMAGIACPVMTSAGSGNQGITIFMTNTVVAEAHGCTREDLLRAIALSNLITIYIKSYTGTLSAMCGCAVSAGAGAAAGVAFLLGGGEKEIFGAMANMIGSIAGMICDGAKEGCASKVALASGWAVQSAFLSLNMDLISNDSGILAGNIRDLSINLSNVCNVGMAEVNHTINGIILDKGKR